MTQRIEAGGALYVGSSPTTVAFAVKQMGFLPYAASSKKLLALF